MGEVQGIANVISQKVFAKKEGVECVKGQY